MNIKIFIMIITCLLLIFWKISEKEEFFDLSNENVVIHAVGDISFSRDIDKYVKKKKKGDFEYPLSYVKPYLSESDLTMANLETVLLQNCDIRKPLYPDSINLCSDQWCLSGVIDNIDIVNIANNHAYDYGIYGLDSTIKNLNKFGIPYIGTKNQPFKIINIKGLKIGLIGIASDFNKLNGSNIFGIKMEIIPNLIKYVSEKSDIVIINIHWGEEYSFYPNIRQKSLARKFVEYGADVIIGHHPHVIQTMEHINVKDRKGTVFYSIGNFLFDSHVLKNGVRNSMILKIIVDNDKNISFEYLPCVIRPDIGFAPIPSQSYFQREFPEHSTIKANNLYKYIKCARSATC